MTLGAGSGSVRIDLRKSGVIFVHVSCKLFPESTPPPTEYELETITPTHPPGTPKFDIPDLVGFHCLTESMVLVVFAFIA